MADMDAYVDFDPLEKCGIKERVRFEVLKELIEKYEGEELIEQCIAHRDELVPKHIIVDDILRFCKLYERSGTGSVRKDDIDHLGNRRLRCVGELLQNQFRIGFSRCGARDPWSVLRYRGLSGCCYSPEPDKYRPVTAAIKEFFGSSPLSQFMDETNPLAELTPLSVVCLLWVPAVCRAVSVQSWTFVTFTTTMVVCAPSKHLKVPTSV